MKCSVVLHAGLLEQADLSGKTVVVIDAFRATSVIVEGLYNGAKAFIPVKTVEEAQLLKEQNLSHLLGGERDGVMIEGFDLDNSPLSYSNEVVGGKVVALTTTNGTRALSGSVGASEVYLGSFLNASAVARRVANVKELVIVCSGSYDELSLEDSVCAGAIIYSLEAQTSIELTDTAYMLKMLFREVREDLDSFLSKGEHYRELVEKGFEKDVQFCLQLNKRSVVPCYDGTTVML
jgi:Phosphosulfolactate phosphohydrolase and related enzymes